MSYDPEDELLIEWIPEDDEDAVPVFDEDVEEEWDAKIQTFNTTDLPTFMVDKMCKKKFGHTNWVRMSNIEARELAMNPCVIDYTEGIVYFKNSRLV